MPRQARIDAPGALHHIICRGIERGQIFTDDFDRDNFVARLDATLLETSTTCYAWALIPNHFHLLLRTGSTPISTVMKRLLTGHAVFFNRRHKRHGHLFQNRFKSIICQEDLYLLELIRYIHLNPLRANLVDSIDELNQFRYSGHRQLLGIEEHGIVSADEVLSLFSRKAAVAREKYAAFLADGAGQGTLPELTGGGWIHSLKAQALHGSPVVDQLQQGDERILGDGDFVELVLTRADEQLAVRQLYRAIDINQLALVVSRLLGIEVGEVWAPGKQPIRVKARSLLCYWAVRELGCTATALAKRLGVSQPAVSMAVQRGEKLAVDRGWVLREVINL